MVMRALCTDEASGGDPHASYSTVTPALADSQCGNKRPLRPHIPACVKLEATRYSPTEIAKRRVDTQSTPTPRQETYNAIRNSHWLSEQVAMAPFVRRTVMIPR